jgi:hypothetical protein
MLVMRRGGLTWGSINASTALTPHVTWRQERGKRDVDLRTVLPFDRQACMETGVHDFNGACRDRFCEPVVGNLRVREHKCVSVLHDAEIDLFRNEAVITYAP